MALIELHPINGEALRDDPVAVHGEQTPAMMRGVVAAALGRHPKAAAHGRAELQWLWARSETRPTTLGSCMDSPPGGGRVELTTRCSRTLGRSAAFPRGLPIRREAMERTHAGRTSPDNPAKNSGVSVHPARMWNHRYQRSSLPARIPRTDPSTPPLGVPLTLCRGFGRQYSS